MNILHVLHSLLSGGAIGGTEFHVVDLINETSNEFTHYSATVRNDNVIIEDWSQPSIKNFNYKISGSINQKTLFHDDIKKAYIDIFKYFNIDLVHIHHFMWGGINAISAALELGLPYFITIHDYYSVCPIFDLVDLHGDYCVIPDYLGYCSQCLSDRMGFDVNAREFLVTWRRIFKGVMDSANTVIFPSASSLEVTKSGLGELNNSNIMVIPHWLNEKVMNSVNRAAVKSALDLGLDEKSICFLGYSKISKGLMMIAFSILPLANAGVKIYILGANGEGFPLRHKNLFIEGIYNRTEVIEKIHSINPTAMVIASAWPETYCYTMSEAILSGIPVIVSPFGAMVERAALYKNVYLMHDYSTQSLMGALQSVISDFGDENEDKWIYNYNKFIEMRKESIDIYNKIYRSTINHRSV